MVTMKTDLSPSVVECTDFPMVVLGGPGSLKTTHANAHIEWLLSREMSVLAVSHTRDAARQLAGERHTTDSVYWHGLKFLGLDEFLHDDNYARRAYEFGRRRVEFTNTYDVVVLDEGQDANREQLRNLWEICEGRMHVFGDIDQCIYEWRDAEPRRLYEFCEFHGIEPLKLEHTVRLTKPLLEASQRLISHNEVRFDVPMKTVKDGPEIEVECVYDDVQATLKRLIEVNSNDVAVLTRNKKGRKWLKLFYDQGLGKRAEKHKPYAGTIHGAKGLEWAHVFIVRANVMEYANAPIEEERRVFYTAMTRSCGFLHISAWKPICFIREALNAS